MTVLTRATRDGIRGSGTVSNGFTVQWLSLIPGRYSPWHVREVPEGARLVVYLESGLDATGYRDILAGKHDNKLDWLAADLPADAIVRWDHEMSSPPNEWRTWGQVPPELYRRVWVYVTARLNRSMFWCPSAHRIDPAYFPGPSYVQFVGFTSYELGVRPAKTGQRIPAPTLWRKPLAAVRALAPGVPVIVGETGSLDDDTGGRLRWLRSVKNVKGVEMVIYFDINMLKDEGRDWTMSGQMLVEWT